MPQTRCHTRQKKQKPARTRRHRVMMTGGGDENILREKFSKSMKKIENINKIVKAAKSGSNAPNPFMGKIANTTQRTTVPSNNPRHHTRLVNIIHKHIPNNSKLSNSELQQYKTMKNSHGYLGKDGKFSAMVNRTLKKFGFTGTGADNARQKMKQKIITAIKSNRVPISNPLSPEARNKAREELKTYRLKQVTGSAGFYSSNA